jgi:RimJ/RimL family protein N-acetyltransferase
MITLRKLTEKDAEMLQKWRNKNRHFFVQTNEVSRKQQEAWFQQYLENPSDLMYVVVEDTKPIGCLGLAINNGEAEIQRVMLGEKEYAQQGEMSKALQLLMRTFGFEKYTLQVLKTNKTAIHFYQKNGFVVIGEHDACFVMEKTYVAII